MVRLFFLGTCAAVLTGASTVHGQGPTGAARCDGPLDRETVVACAVRASPEARQARAELDAIAGRRLAAGVWLPTNPVLALTTARRRGAEASLPVQAVNWSAVLSQEIEVGGQRGARLTETDSEAAAQVRRLYATEQAVAAQALTIYFETVAGRQALTLADGLRATAETFANVAEARAREALAPGVEADLARAEAARLGLLRIDVGRRLASVTADLALLLDVDPRALQPEGDLQPVTLPPPDAGTPSYEDQALRLRGEIGVATLEREVLERRLVRLRRERIPNLIFSAFAARDGFAEQVLGAGISLPIPLPAPLGRTRAGEIAETQGQIRAAEASLDLVRRRVRLEVAQAQANYEARKQAVALFSADLVMRARKDIAALGEAITARQFSVREALVAQRTLIELLQADHDARLAEVLASVELARVAGIPFGGKQP